MCRSRLFIGPDGAPVLILLLLSGDVDELRDCLLHTILSVFHRQTHSLGLISETVGEMASCGSVVCDVGL